MTDQKPMNTDERIVSWISNPGLGFLICTISAVSVITGLALLYFKFAQ